MVGSYSNSAESPSNCGPRRRPECHSALPGTSQQQQPDVQDGIGINPAEPRTQDVNPVVVDSTHMPPPPPSSHRPTRRSSRQSQPSSVAAVVRDRRQPTPDLRALIWLWLTLVGFAVVATVDAASQFSNAPYPEVPGRPPTNTTHITDILNQLVHESRYDKRLRPNYGGKPVDVGITIHVSSISAVSEVQMDFTLDFYLRQMWKDPRLSYAHTDYTDDLVVGVDYKNKLWVPDTFFPNEKNSFFHLATTHNSFLRINPDGNITTSQRLTVTATCPMHLKLFPLDSQKCTLEIESCEFDRDENTTPRLHFSDANTAAFRLETVDGFTTKDIKLLWYNGEKNSLKIGDVYLPQFKVKEIKAKSSSSTTTTGTYMRLKCYFLFTRLLGYYVVQIYLPSMLIVVISWVSFWLSREATPARVALGVTTVLTMTTLMTTTNAQMPKVSYVKSIDIYLGTCFLMVFASLIEYATVGYMNKKLKMHHEQLKKEAAAQGKLIALQNPPVNSNNSDTCKMESQPPTSTGATEMQPLITRPAMYYAGQDMSHYIPPGSYVSPRMSPNVNTNSRYMALQQPSFPAAVCSCQDGCYGTGHQGQLYSPTHPSLLANAAHFQEIECDCDMSKNSMLYENAAGIFSIMKNPMRAMKLTAPKRHTGGKFMLGVTPSAIDKYSRIMFPLLFIVFNAIYWVTYVHISSQDSTLGEDGFTVDDIAMQWHKKPDNLSVNIPENVRSLAQFQAVAHWVETHVSGTSTGKYVRLKLHIRFDRSSGFYILNIFVPSILIVVISWVSFWLNREAAPARVALGVTTVLTMTTLMTTTNAQMPKVSYVKSIDVYLGTCFLMVFAALIEYACVTYLSKKLKMKRERAQKKEREAAGLHQVDAKSPVNPDPRVQASNEFPMFPATTTMMQDGRGGMQTSGMRFRGSPPLDYRCCNAAAAGQTPAGYPQAHSVQCDCELSNSAVPFIVRLPKPKRQRRKQSNWRITASTIDKYSRICFPIAFCIFNDGYAVSQVKHYWQRGEHSVKLADAIRTDGTLSTFELGIVDIDDDDFITSTGVYVRLLLTINFHRNIGFYFATVYLPSILVVMISWVSFWISRDSAPARVLLGITTVLTMTTLLTNTNRSLPPVSYLKAIDIFLGMCYFMVVASLLEYACVSYSAKKLADRAKRKAKKEKEKEGEQTQQRLREQQFQELKAKVLEAPRSSTSTGGMHETSFTQQTTSVNYRPNSAGVRSSVGSAAGQRELPPCTCEHGSVPIASLYQQNPYSCAGALGFVPPPSQASGLAAAAEETVSLVAPVYGAQPQPRRRLCGTWWKCLRVNPVAVDRYSRIGFPLVFLILNGAYWTWLFKNSVRPGENVDE